MKVLFSKHNSICEIGVTRAFVNNGLEVVNFEKEIKDVDGDSVFEACLIRMINEEHPDFVFSINFIPIIAKVCNKYSELKYACWVVDCPVLGLYNKAINLKNNYIFVFDSIQYSEFAPRCRNSHIFHFPLGTDLEEFEGIHTSSKDAEIYGKDVSFVGSLYSEKSPYNSIESRLSPYIQGYIRAVLEAQSLICGSNIISESVNENIIKQLNQCIVLEEQENYDIDVKSMICNVLLNPKCTEIERISTLKEVSNYFEVDLYTNSNTSMLPKVNCHGPVGTYGGMVKVFKNSKINLNITAKGIQAGGSLRVYDILACKGMLITNYQADLAKQFVDNQDLVFYYSREDLIEKIDYYLRHEKERNQIAYNGYIKVKNKFTYTTRIADMLKLINM